MALVTFEKRVDIYFFHCFLSAEDIIFLYPVRCSRKRALRFSFVSLMHEKIEHGSVTARQDAAECLRE